jgi:hypothetical protein
LNLQHAVYEVIRRLAANQISTRHAGMILTTLDKMSRSSPPSSPTTSSPEVRSSCGIFPRPQQHSEEK